MTKIVCVCRLVQDYPASSYVCLCMCLCMCVCVCVCVAQLMAETGNNGARFKWPLLEEVGNAGDKIKKGSLMTIAWREGPGC